MAKSKREPIIAIVSVAAEGEDWKLDTDWRDDVRRQLIEAFGPDTKVVVLPPGGEVDLMTRSSLEEEEGGDA